MHIEIPLDEALTAVTALVPVPAFVTALAPDAEGVRFVVDLRLVPDPSAKIRLAAALMPLVRGTVHITGFDSGTLTLTLRMNGKMPADLVLGHLVQVVRRRLAAANLPAEAVRASGDQLSIDAQVLLHQVSHGLLSDARITRIASVDETLMIDATL